MNNDWSKNLGSPDLARIVADISSDGHLQLKDWRGLVSFYSNDKSKINKINNKIFRMFGVKGRIYTKLGKNLQYRIFFISKPLALFLRDIGTPDGNKVNKPFYVPDWIIKGDDKVIRSYLQGLFSGEGSIYPTKNKDGSQRWRISIEMYKYIEYEKEGLEYFNQIKYMINKLGVYTSPARFGRKNKRKDNTYSIALKLDIESKQFSKFYKGIGFDDKDKTKKLLGVIAEAQRRCAEVSSKRRLQTQAA